ncbi:expressed unknown protein [Seminavis robusta]|uniref:Uncharacterized protein n=1 Tax=Seminavis robusta TaxID=568900 RepID=A0A9N8D5T6_9STRA|nr:expressed unknown protein [Seminavis robusta]|eukprot:Sro12_g009560.1 n/a (508) ;mRNA; f:151999-153619
MDCESCGWAAAVVAVVSFGSFGVPIKSETCRRLNIDPLVFQTYKTVVCFLSSAVILAILGRPFRFTPWGIVSAIFWVPAGVGTVAAVKLAGLAVAIAVGNSLVALVSFTWGILIFHEPIHSISMACVGVMMMILGFCGMSYFSTRDRNNTDNGKPLPLSSPQQQQLTMSFHYEAPLETPTGSSCNGSIQTCPSSSESIELVEEARRQYRLCQEIHDFEAKTFRNNRHHSRTNGDHHHEIHNTQRQHLHLQDEKHDENSNIVGGLRHRQVHLVHHHSNEMVSSPTATHDKKTAMVLSPSVEDAIPAFPSPPPPSNAAFTFTDHHDPQPNDTFLVLAGGACKLTRRQVGIALSIFNGCWGGSILVPMKFCPDPTITRGVDFVWSFSIGAMLVTASLWLGRFLWNYAASGDSSLAYRSLPPLHLKEMWKPGGLSGLLWSTGNLFSILSVDYLGEGVGYCVVQASMLVSGLFGIFYFKEVKGMATISKWFLSALLTVSGILVLSYEHHDTS